MPNRTLGITVLGATGRMGQLVLAGIHNDPALHLVAAVTRKESPRVGQRVLADDSTPAVFQALSANSFAEADVVIDFSLPEALTIALDHLDGQPLVTGTTGLNAATLDKLTAYAAEAPVIAAANFSTGVNLLLDLVARAARALPQYDIEVVEAHHHHKKDAPSGTALALGHAMAEARNVSLDAVAQAGREGQQSKRQEGQIGFHSLRCGDVVGDHTVWLAGAGEHIRLSHTATTRETFAAGAIRAAKWLASQPPGRYTMSNVIGLTD